MNKGHFRLSSSVLRVLEPTVSQREEDWSRQRKRCALGKNRSFQLRGFRKAGLVVRVYLKRFKRDRSALLLFCLLAPFVSLSLPHGRLPEQYILRL